MEQVLLYLDFAPEHRQVSKVRHKIKDVIALTFFAELSNAEKWEDVEVFAASLFLLQFIYINQPTSFQNNCVTKNGFCAEPFVIFPHFVYIGSWILGHIDIFRH